MLGLCFGRDTGHRTIPIVEGGGIIGIGNKLREIIGGDV